ncbi:MAG TPA: hypothetical protein VLJ16_04285 [Acidobacteriota bacterium]|nr:hypothetical protein [Acidobacteriota bacterium]
MKLAKIALAVLILAVAAAPQTKDLGLGAFSNESGAILMAIDAALVNQNLNSPYVMFVAFMAAAGDQALAVAAKDVVMVYKGQEYHMPSLQELRGHYRGEIRDLDFYQRLGREGLNASWIRYYRFVSDTPFFPPLTTNAPLAAKEGHMSANLGFLTPLYFKNPGFVKGDKLTIKVQDVKNPDLTGACDIVLK